MITSPVLSSQGNQFSNHSYQSSSKLVKVRVSEQQLFTMFQEPAEPVESPVQLESCSPDVQLAVQLQLQTSPDVQLAVSIKSEVGKHFLVF